MKLHLTIGELSKEVGLPTKTIRFYESVGLIDKTNRGENGYRQYSMEQVESLKLIKNARELGLPIPQIKKLMIGCENGDCSHSQQYIDKEIGEYLGVLTEKIEKMTLLKSKLQQLQKVVDTCSDETGGKYCCNVLGQIAQLPEGGESK